MSTRGFVGFVIDGKEKIMYNHSDSYPSGVGQDVLAWLYAALDSIDSVRERARGIRLVREADKPTTEERERYRQYTDAGDDWYAVLRLLQGDPGGLLRAGIMTDDADFARDSSFCEWGYLVDLDAAQFEVYKGFQEAPHDRGRFASRGSPVRDGHYPVALVASWAFDELPSVNDLMSLDSEDS